jgi:tRNA dimethylallyltransferase
MTGDNFDLLVILGATAGGKTGLAVAAARRFHGEIISADSRQVYRGMDLGTGKDLHEYAEVPYHLIDIADPGDEYNLFRFQRDAFAAIQQIQERSKLPILCGGSAMYLDAVVRGYRLVEVPENPELRQKLAHYNDEQLRSQLLELKPDQHNRTDLDQRDRLLRAIEIAIGERESEAKLPPLPQIRPLVCGLRWPRAELHRRIGRRLEERLNAGMIEEVSALHAQGVSWNQLEFYGLEYRFIARYLQQQISREEMVSQLRSAIANFAKRQETFFRNMEKKGVAIHWLDGDSEPFAQLCRIVDAQCS